MRSLRPDLGNNVGLLSSFWGKCGVNEAASPTGWTQGGKGMGVPVRTGAGVLTITFKDPPPGALQSVFADMETDALANAMNVDFSWSEDVASPPHTYVLTLFWAARGTPGTAADPPAAAAGRQFVVGVEFSDPANV